MIKKIRLNNVNQCQKIDDGFCRIVKLIGDTDLCLYGKLDDDWQSSSSSFVTFTDILGQKHSINKSSIDYINHGLSKWSLHFHYKAKVDNVELGELMGYACVPDNLELEFDTQNGDIWDYLNKEWYIKTFR
ncbi:hypothetical protein [Aeromonas hydrophila]|uniref:hypothetical protein n=1 Tax=Aeromonas hydrophila TaxID=644 RepID=UPI002B476EDF|nr:hypothetical protein [Aeromonas hydrophila]